MDVNNGFKITELGVLPEEWEVKPLAVVGDIATGTTPPTSNRNNYGEDYFFVSPADLGKGKYIIDTEKKLSKLGFSISRKYPANSILFTCIGSTIGKAGIAKIELTSNQQINAVFPNNFHSTDYLFYYLSFISPKIKLGASEQAVPMINKTEYDDIDQNCYKSHDEDRKIYIQVVDVLQSLSSSSKTNTIIQWDAYYHYLVDENDFKIILIMIIITISVLLYF